MEHKPITFKAINRNPNAFYRRTYPVISMEKNELINISELYRGKKIIAVDCAGWHYQNIFSDSDVYRLEGVYVCKNVSMDKSKFDRLYDDKDVDNLKFPVLNFENTVLLLDHSPMLKYRTGPELNKVLEDLVRSTDPDIIHLRLPLVTTNDFRLGDRFTELTTIVPAGYITTMFNFNLSTTEKPMLTAKFTKIKKYAASFD